MKMLLIALMAVAVPSFAKGRSYSKKSSKTYSSPSRPVKVRADVRKSGKFVAPHYKKSPNKTKMDNYGTKGNVNPFTGKKGTTDPLK